MSTQIVEPEEEDEEVRQARWCDHYYAKVKRMIEKIKTEDSYAMRHFIWGQLIDWLGMAGARRMMKEGDEYRAMGLDDAVEKVIKDLGLDRKEALYDVYRVEVWTRRGYNI
jgi:hypothetical protein